MRKNVKKHLFLLSVVLMIEPELHVGWANAYHWTTSAANKFYCQMYLSGIFHYERFSLFIIVYMCVCVWVRTCSAGACRGQRCWMPRKLELQVVVSPDISVRSWTQVLYVFLTTEPSLQCLLLTKSECLTVNI